MQSMFSSWRTKSVHSAIIFFAFSFAVQASTLTTAQLKTISNQGEHAAKAEGAVFLKDSIQQEKAKLDDSNTSYVVVMYTIEGMRGGNSFEVRLALFKEEAKEKLALLQDLLISHRNHGAFMKFQIKEKKIILDGLKLAKNDGLCCPSIPVTATLKLEGSKLTLIKGSLLTH